MDRVFIRKVLGQVRKRFKTFDVPGCRQSRRIDGMFDRDDEIQGFKNLCIYVDTALAGKEDLIGRILGHIDSFIYGQEHYNHTRWLMFFGSKPDRLVAPRPSVVHQAIHPAAWKATITKCIVENPAIGGNIIPKLHNPGSSNTHFPDRYDLALIFCKGRDIATYEDQQKNFETIRQRTLWFIFGDEELPELYAQGFMPKTRINFLDSTGYSEYTGISNITEC